MFGLTFAVPFITYKSTQNERKLELLSSISKQAKEFSVKYVLNDGGNKEWNDWLKKAEKAGYKELVNIFNTAQKRYDAK